MTFYIIYSHSINKSFLTLFNYLNNFKSEKKAFYTINNNFLNLKNLLLIWQT